MNRLRCGLVFLIGGLACAGVPVPEVPPVAEVPTPPAAVPRAVVPRTGRWVDPEFAPRKEGVRAVVWFDRQLLEGEAAYAERTAAWADRPRSAVRAEVLRELHALSDASWGAAREEIERLEASGAVRDCRRHWIVNGFTCVLPEGDPSVLDRVPGIREVFRAGPVPVRSTPELGPRFVTDLPVDPPFRPKGDPGTWNQQRLHVPKVWRELGRTGKGVLVVVQDEGFRLDLPPIAGRLWRNPAEIPGNGIDDEGDGYVDDVHGFAFDSDDAAINRPPVREHRPIHGNAVAALVVGRRRPGVPATFGGAPDATWAGVTANGRLEASVEWALDHHADVYSMSFSIGKLGDLRSNWRKVLEHAALAGLFCVTGAGNFGDPSQDDFQPIPVQMRTPEDIPLAVFGVAGIGPNGRVPRFSSRGPVEWSTAQYRDGMVEKPDFATIDEGVPTLGADGTMQQRPGAGNSFAGPHLAAVLALMIEADPELTPWAARQVLIETSEDLGAPGFDHEAGYGLVDAFRAVQAVERLR